MLKAAIDDGAKDFRLEEKIAESGTVDGNVSSLNLLLGSVGRCWSICSNLGLKRLLLEMN